MGTARGGVAKKSLPLLAALVSVLVLAGPASAATGGGSGSGMTLSITSTQLLARGAAVAVGVDVVCQPLNGVTALVPSMGGPGTVTLTQVAGRTVTSASGWLTNWNTVFTCDGTTVNHLVSTVFASTQSGPFKPGSAIVEASLGVTDPNNFFGPLDSGDTGPVTVRLGR